MIKNKQQVIISNMHLPSIPQHSSKKSNHSNSLIQRNFHNFTQVHAVQQIKQPPAISQLNPFQAQGKLQSQMDRNKYFSVDQYRQQLKLKIQSSTAFEDQEHKELRDILKKVMASSTIDQSQDAPITHRGSPKGPDSQSTVNLLKSQQMYNAIIAKNKRSRMDSQSLHFPSNQGQTMPIDDGRKGRFDSNYYRTSVQIDSFNHAPLSHSILFALKKTMPKEGSIINRNGSSDSQHQESRLSINHSQSLQIINDSNNPYQMINKRMTSISKGGGIIMPNIIPAGRFTETPRKGGRLSNETQKIATKIISKLPEQKKLNLSKILNQREMNNNLSYRSSQKQLEESKREEYRFTIDTFEDHIHFQKRNSQSPEIVIGGNPFSSRQIPLMMNQGSTVNFGSINKPDKLSNIQIAPLSNLPSNASKLSNGNDLNMTMLGIQEIYNTINEVTNREFNSKISKKQGALQYLAVEKLRRTLIPLFSGGLAREKLVQLNQLSEEELNQMKKDLKNDSSLMLKLQAPFKPLYKSLDKTEDDILFELYHTLGRNSLQTMKMHFRDSGDESITVKPIEGKKKLKIPFKKWYNDEGMPVVNMFVRKITKQTGQIPASREQFGALFHEGLYYMFGGASQQSYNDIKRLDPSRFEWKNIEPTSKIQPKQRFGHSFNVWRDFLVMFGGGGHYIHEIKRRQTYSDILIFDIEENRWFDPILERNNSKLSSYRITNSNSQHHDDEMIDQSISSQPASQRLGHASAMLGCTLIIHGGINAEENVMITDGVKDMTEFALFDFQVCQWIKIKQAMLEIEDQPAQPINLVLGPLAHHTMTPVYDSLVQNNQQFQTRFMWIRSPQDIAPPTKEREKSLIKHQGIYIFGGYNKTRECGSNTLFIMKPDFKQNQKAISLKTAAFKKLLKPKYTYELHQVDAVGGGQPPCPRFLHSTAFIMNRYLVIYGGRNDKMFQIAGTVAMNDMHLFDLHNLQWVTVALFCQDGAIPLSRWGHTLVSSQENDSMLLFGGVNLKSYCEGSAIYEFVFDDKICAIQYEDSQMRLQGILNKARAESGLSGATQFAKQGTITSEYNKV